MRGALNTRVSISFRAVGAFEKRLEAARQRDRAELALRAAQAEAYGRRLVAEAMNLLPQVEEAVALLQQTPPTGSQWSRKVQLSTKKRFLDTPEMVGWRVATWIFVPLEGPASIQMTGWPTVTLEEFAQCGSFYGPGPVYEGPSSPTPVAVLFNELLEALEEYLK